MNESCLAANSGSRRTGFCRDAHDGMRLESEAQGARAAPAPAPAPQPRRSASPSPSDPITSSDRGLPAALPRRRARAQAGSPRTRPDRVRSRGRGAARVAVWRPDRRPAARALRSAGRPHQRATKSRALAQGDGFAEKKSEPASIDELLKIATFPKPAAGADTEKTVKADLAATEHDVPIPQNERVLAYVELFQGRLRDYIQESLTRGTKYLPMIQDVFRAEGPAARPRLHPGHRERLQDERALEGQRQGPVAVHARDRHRAGPQDGLVRRRAIRSREGDDCRREVPEDAARHVRSATGTWCSPRTTAASAGCSAR